MWNFNCAWTKHQFDEGMLLTNRFWSRKCPASNVAFVHNIHTVKTELNDIAYKQVGAMASHQPHDWLINRLFGRRSKKTSKLRVTGLCVGNSTGPVNSPRKWPITPKMFPFDDVMMYNRGRCFHEIILLQASDKQLQWLMYNNCLSF